MNEILSIILITLFSELCQRKKSKNEEDSDEEDINMNAYIIYQHIHDEEYIWADAYSLFERILDLGIKDLYYKDSN